MKHLVNAETWNFNYNDKKLLDFINVTRRDKSIKGYKINFYYNDDNSIMNIVKHYRDDKVWNDLKFNYSNGLLIEIKDCFYLINSCSTQKINYDKEGLITKIEYFQNNKMTYWTEYSYELFNDK